jgi:hypothetical protein
VDFYKKSSFCFLIRAIAQDKEKQIKKTTFRKKKEFHKNSLK